MLREHRVVLDRGGARRGIGEMLVHAGGAACILLDRRAAGLPMEELETLRVVADDGQPLAAPDRRLTDGALFALRTLHRFLLL